MFLEPQAAVYLEDKVLDAQLDEDGNASFSLAMLRISEPSPDPGAHEAGVAEFP